MQPVVIQLQKAKVIGRAEYASIEVFEGMEMYLEQHGLRTMQTFNGRALRILQHIERSPDRRALIEVKPWCADDDRDVAFPLSKVAAFAEFQLRRSCTNWIVAEVIIEGKHLIWGIEPSS